MRPYEGYQLRSAVSKNTSCLWWLSLKPNESFGAKAPFVLRSLMYGLKPVPSKLSHHRHAARQDESREPKTES